MRDRSGLAGLLGLLAFALVQRALAEAQVLRRDLHELVGGDVLDRALEGELGRRCEAGGDARALGTEIRELLRADGVAGDVLVARVLADDHALVNFLAGTDEE